MGNPRIPLVTTLLLALGCGSGDTGGEEPPPSPYACGWQPGDPGDLVASGASEGDTISDITLIDQCDERLPLWTFAGDYHVIFLTAAW